MKNYKRLVAAVTLLAVAAILVVRFVLPADRFGPVEVVDTNAIHRIQAEKSLPELLLVDINSADTEELQNINGIGPALAQAIVDYRQRNGPFASTEDLILVKGIGEKSLASMLPYCYAGQAKQAEESAETTEAGD